LICGPVKRHFSHSHTLFLSLSPESQIVVFVEEELAERYRPFFSLLVLESINPFCLPSLLLLVLSLLSVDTNP
jgi:hypothetical protein